MSENAPSNEQEASSPPSKSRREFLKGTAGALLGGALGLGFMKTAYPENVSVVKDKVNSQLAIVQAGKDITLDAIKDGRVPDELQRSAGMVSDNVRGGASIFKEATVDKGLDGVAETVKTNLQDGASVVKDAIVDKGADAMAGTVKENLQEGVKVVGNTLSDLRDK